ncbi:hypothetical protein [Parafrankia sp. FMc2]|uniref:hypothetical protein n=1 Tax=Parafrankia sp. FMc2 TaxID=3233196 RepID=UPI0034D6A814
MAEKTSRSIFSFDYRYLPFYAGTSYTALARPEKARTFAQQAGVVRPRPAGAPGQPCPHASRRAAGRPETGAGSAARSRQADTLQWIFI